MKPATLELGGKSANIVFDDAELDTACGLGTMMSVGVLSGQGCAFPTRMLVQQSIYEDVVARVAAVAWAKVTAAASEVPPNDSKGSGSMPATYDTASKKLSYKGSYSGLTGPATAAHFHGPAEPGNSAAVQIPVFSDATAKSPFEGEATLTDAQPPT